MKCYTQTTSKVGSCQGVALNLSQAEPTTKQLNLNELGDAGGLKFNGLRRWQKSTFEVVWVYSLLLVTLLCFIGSLTHLDRIFFKRNAGFCVRFLYTNLPNNPEWNLAPLSEEQRSVLDLILNQKFHYLAKGAHCFAFISEDNNYVIKFQRYASHMRVFPWLNHPLGYLFDAKRMQIKKHNIEQLHHNFLSYKESYEHLKEETGLLLLHLNRTSILKKTLTLVDKTQAEYTVPLDQVTFILQRRADLIYPTLDKLYKAGDLEKGRQVISQILHLIYTCCQKGYIDQDPVLRKNYGLLEDRAIHIDVGDLVKNEEVQSREQALGHVKEITESLKKRLEHTYPKLLESYKEEISDLGKNSLN